MNNKVDLKGATLKINNPKTTGDSQINVGVINSNARTGKKKRNQKKQKNQTKKVFVAHGHNIDLLNDTVHTLDQISLECEINLDVVVSISLPNLGNTIIEKVERSSNVDYAIVLYTPCDIGGTNGVAPKLQPRARQNVVFEHGYLMSKIGRNKVFVLTKGLVEMPSNVSGTIPISTDDCDWHEQLKKEFLASL